MVADKKRVKKGESTFLIAWHHALDHAGATDGAMYLYRFGQPNPNLINNIDLAFPVGHDCDTSA